MWAWTRGPATAGEAGRRAEAGGPVRASGTDSYFGGRAFRPAQPARARIDQVTPRRRGSLVRRAPESLWVLGHRHPTDGREWAGTVRQRMPGSSGSDQTRFPVAPGFTPVVRRMGAAGRRPSLPRPGVLR